ncbi:endoplasmic reticulum-Golgi intermediate compartment protein 2-like isoform X2 [Branchiostoma lanceolatum]|uniref:endoplasmic reticulum-Golgi intermediate compartment protein 2-like isoform X2 n=1 Tax=Branchiostoma lanceolatum TaxID=7740 RepID=UPI0034518166
MRRRLSQVRRESVGLVKRVDAFPKIPDDCREKSTTGATVSLLSFSVIAILVTSEVQRYGRSEIRYQYEVDREISEKLNITVDITVAMPCEYVGADVTNSLGHYWSLRDQMTYFELTEKQKREQRKLQSVRRAINAKRSLRDVILQSGLDTSRTIIRHDHKTLYKKQVDACRFHGQLEIDKVSGTLHIMAGRSVQHGSGHNHYLAPDLLQSDKPVTYNFSHRIDLLSFGALTPGILNPLDGEEKNTDTGIYIAFELSSIRVHITEEERSLGHLAVRLCGIIGGVYTTSGVLYSLMATLTAQLFGKDETVQVLQETITTDGSVQEQEETVTVELH